MGQALGLPTTMIGFSLLALLITSASAAVLPGAKSEELWNPEYLRGIMTSAAPAPGMAEPLIASAATRAMVAIIAVFGIVIAALAGLLAVTARKAMRLHDGGMSGASTQKSNPVSV